MQIHEYVNTRECIRQHMAAARAQHRPGETPLPPLSSPPTHPLPRTSTYLKRRHDMRDFLISPSPLFPLGRPLRSPPLPRQNKRSHVGERRQSAAENALIGRPGPAQEPRAPVTRALGGARAGGRLASGERAFFIYNFVGVISRQRPCSD